MFKSGSFACNVVTIKRRIQIDRKKYICDVWGQEIWRQQPWGQIPATEYYIWELLVPVWKLHKNPKNPSSGVLSVILNSKYQISFEKEPSSLTWTITNWSWYNVAVVCSLRVETIHVPKWISDCWAPFWIAVFGARLIHSSGGATLLLLLVDSNDSYFGHCYHCICLEKWHLDAGTGG